MAAINIAGLAEEDGKEITFTVKFFKGKGGINFAGENIPVGTAITSESGNKSFSVTQSAGSKDVAVNGIAPSDGSITVEVQDKDGNVISPASENTYSNTDGIFNGDILYTL